MERALQSRTMRRRPAAPRIVELRSWFTETRSALVLPHRRRLPVETEIRPQSICGGIFCFKMNRFAAIVVFICFHLASFTVTAGAGEAPSATPYSGDIWNRSTLTGDWGGLRNQLAEKGVTLDLSVTQVGQGVVNGGKSGAWQYGGRGDIILNLDSQKLGLWPG